MDIITATRRGNINRIKKIINKLPLAISTSIVNIQNHLGNTALLYASDIGNPKIVKILIDAGADVNLHNNIGFSPLLIACKKGHIKVVKQLINAGADINYELNGLNGLNALLASVYSNSPEILTELIHAGIDVNLISSNGLPVLYFATGLGYLKMVKILVENGADLYAEYDGCTAGMIASKHGREYTLQEYINNISIQRQNHLNILKYLLDNGLNPNKVSSKFKTIYNTACPDSKNYLDNRYGDSIVKSNPEEIEKDFYELLVSDLEKKDKTIAKGLHIYKQHHHQKY